MSLGLNDQGCNGHDDAAREFRQILKADPLNVQAHFDLGLSLFELHQADDAAKELQAALAIAPYYTRAEELLGSISLSKRAITAARKSSFATSLPSTRTTLARTIIWGHWLRCKDNGRKANANCRRRSKQTPVILTPTMCWEAST